MTFRENGWLVTGSEGGVSDAVHSMTRGDTCPSGSYIVWRPRDRRMCQGNGFIGQNMELGCYRIVMLWREGILILDARGQAKIFHNCLPYWHCNTWTHPSAVSVFIRVQKPIFCCTDPPWRGATCPNKTNKSGGPKDVADAWPLPPPCPSDKDAILEWLERMNGDNECPVLDSRHNGTVPPNIEPEA